MEVVVHVPKYNKETGVQYKWENDFEIRAKLDNGAIILEANKQGLVSLANHLLNLAQDEIPSGYHFHFDENNALEEGSAELIIEKI